VADELLVNLLVLVHRTRPGNLLYLADGLVQVVLVQPRIQAPDGIAETRFEYGRGLRLPRVSPGSLLLIDNLPAERLESGERRAFGLGVFVGHLPG